MKPKQDMKAMARLGGAAVKAKYPSEHFQKIGAEGGTALRESWGHAHFSEIGRRGGEVVSNRPEHMQRMGKAGGQATAERYGLAHYQSLGHKGAEARRRKAALGAGVVAAVTPFLPWLEVLVEQNLQLLLAVDPGAAESPIQPGNSSSPSFGDCARLLAAMRGQPVPCPTLPNPVEQDEVLLAAHTQSAEVGR